MQLRTRDLLALGLAGLVLLAAAATGARGTALAAAAFGVLVGIGLPRLFGGTWRDCMVSLGVGVAIPIACSGLTSSGGAWSEVRFILPALGALPLAYALVQRHPDPTAARRLLLPSAGLAAIVALTTLWLGGSSQSGLRFSGSLVDVRFWLMGAITLVPAVGVAFGSGRSGSLSTLAERLSIVAIGITPGAAMTVLPRYYPDPLLFIGWLLLLVVWRRFSIAPLLRLAQRTQAQRDLIVAVAEAERARLAADLHDDALQDLTGLVRRLDAAGDPEGAELARGIADRLRAICSDLRLPLLDDLGVGPALEWLVARVQPLAEGAVDLERSDVGRPPPNVELAIFRVAQEALANAVKHGRTPIRLRYQVDGMGRVSLSVDDAGPGIDLGAAEAALASGHFGVASMQQRAEQIGGILDIRRWPAGGTHVALEWRPR